MAEADIEDMFDADFYLRLVNTEYAKALKAPVQPAALGKGLRIVPKLENIFSAGAAGGLSFNHYRPARYLTEHLTELEKHISEQTLGRFEAAFKLLNGLLKA